MQKDPTQPHESSLHQGNHQHHEDPTQLHKSSQHQGNMQKDPTQPHESSLHQGNHQHHEDPTQLHESSQHQGNVQNNIEPAPPSQIWPKDLISILQKIMATPCQPPTKPIFNSIYQSKQRVRTTSCSSTPLGETFKELLTPNPTHR
jgi:hypothetical protein